MKKTGKKPAGERRRIVVILLLGLPGVLFVYFYYLEKQGGLDFSLPFSPSSIVTKVKDLMPESIPWVSQSEEETTESEDLFAPGSAGNLARMNGDLRLRGQEMNLEDQRELARNAFRDGKIAADEE